METRLFPKQWFNSNFFFFKASGWEPVSSCKDHEFFSFFFFPHWIFWAQTASLTESETSQVFVVVQSLSHVWLFVTLWTASRQLFLSFTISRSLLKLMSIELMMLFQPSHPLSPTSPPALNLSQHQSLFQWVSSSHQVARGLEFELKHQSFRWTFRTD